MHIDIKRLTYKSYGELASEMLDKLFKYNPNPYDEILTMTESFSWNQLNTRALGGK